MSRDADGTPAPMSDQRRESIAAEVRAAMEWAIPFPSERFIVTVVRIDGPITELVMHEEVAHGEIGG